MDNSKITIAQGVPLKVADMASIFGYSTKSLRNYSVEGSLPALKSSRFPCGIEAMQKLVNFLRNKGPDDLDKELQKEKYLLTKSRRRKEAALATKHENKSVNLDLVEEVWVTVGNDIRNTLIASVPSLIQDLHAAKTDRDKERIITKSFEDTLNKLSDGSSDEILKLHEKTLEGEDEEQTEDDQED